MNKPTYFIGVDVSKKTLDLAVSLGHESLFHFKVSNDLCGLQLILARLKSNDIETANCIFCIEYTGIYSTFISTSLVQNGCQVWMESGVRIKRSIGIERGKNDKVDAIRISQYAYRFSDRFIPWEPVDETISTIKRLMANRRRLVKAKEMLRVPLKEMESVVPAKELRMLQKINQSAIDGIKKQIKVIEGTISSRIRSDENLSHLFQIVTSVRGVGPISGWQIITSTHGFKKIKTAKKYACYSGVAPFGNTSGTSVKGPSKVSHMANKACKRALHLAALSAISHPCEYREYYDRKVKEGKHKLAVINAIRNKIIHRVFACVRDNRKYEDSYQHALA